MLLVLETLNPTERAVFVLREVFDFGYDEIAAAVDKTPAAVRQIAQPRPRATSTSGGRAATSRPRSASEVIARFLEATVDRATCRA